MTKRQAAVLKKEQRMNGIDDLTPQDLASWFRNSEAGQGLLAARRREREQHRAALVREHSEVAASRDREIPKSLRALEKAQSEYVKAETQWKESFAALSAARSALTDVRNRHERRLAKLEAQIRESVPPSIAAFLSQLDEIAKSVRVTVAPDPASVDQKTGRAARYLSNEAHVRLVIEAIRDARERVAELQYREVTNLDAELGRIRAAIPLQKLDELVAA
jgi:hypothetical protein